MMFDQIFTIYYRNTFRDLIAFYFYHYFRQPVFICTFGLSFLLISYSIFQAVPINGPPVARGVTFFILEFLVLLFVGALFIIPMILGMISRRNKTLLTEHIVKLGEASILVETAYQKTDLKWAAVQKLVCTKKYIFIYISQHMAAVIPRRAFRDQSEWDSFYEYDYCLSSKNVMLEAFKQA